MIKQSVYLHYLSALTDGDRLTCVSIVDNLVSEEVDIKTIYVDLLQKSMYRIGHLWEKSRASIATEHVATKITENILSMLYPVVSSSEKIGKTAVITCVDKEFHELGARMISDYLEYKGWTTYYLGANVPRIEVLNLIKEKKPDLIGISANLYVNIIRAFKFVEEIKKERPEQKIIVGGQAFTHEDAPNPHQLEECSYLGSLDELDNFIANL
ncbi:MAG: hypothetical protein SCALA702_10460 [Melioribacteraceae bacterium]|nr:MAG: hypothetical protein SCALA702_10460 [Melioribacteraceae bacterium]